eukprot:Lithocolla_globosa_v1_NODE_7028_length_1002_cov_140.520042.p1 type:complete len:259 gc:universal NODE_7028_length_1002_cov_140.520042:163-939(+)
MELVRDYVEKAITPHCTQTLFEEFNPDVVCMKLTLSKLLGFGMILGGTGVKLPQLLKILKAGSAEGISVLAYCMELFVYTETVGYNLRFGYAFSTYGENVFLTIQDILILLLMFHFSKNYLGLFGYFALYAAFCALTFQQLLTEDLSVKLHSFVTPMLLVSRIPQIYSNYSNGSTGNLSAVTIFLFAAGTTARIFTTLQEVEDMVVLYGYIAGTAVNLILALQVVYYWNSPKNNKNKKSTKEQATVGSRTTKKVKKID